MPVEVFRNREIDLIRLEAKVQALEKALVEERESMDAYLQRMKDLERVINEEQKAMELQAWKDKTKWGVLGLAIGVVIGIAAD
jgi:predicted Holliday junction resolvase-like endonuclease